MAEPSDPEEIRSIQRKEAQSGQVSYGDPIVLHESSRTRVTFVPFFIARSDGTDLAIKIVTYRKVQPTACVQVEEKSTSLQEGAARKLLQALRDHLVVADKTGYDGNYLVLRLSEGTATLGNHSPEKVANALVRVLGQPEIAKHLEGSELSEELVSAFRGALRLREMQTAVAMLRQLLDSGQHDESLYQNWCEHHSWAFGNAYVMRDSVRELSPGDSIDMLLPTVISGFRDIVELKRPDMKLLLWDDAHRNFYFSADVSKAIGQCHRYLDVLHELAAKGLRDHPEIVAYHPRSIIVIGRSNDWPEEKLRALHGLNCRLSRVTIMTYDQLLAQGERLIQMLGRKDEPDGHAEAEPDLDTFTTLDADPL